MQNLLTDSLRSCKLWTAIVLLAGLIISTEASPLRATGQETQTSRAAGQETRTGTAQTVPKAIANSSDERIAPRTMQVEVLGPGGKPLVGAKIHASVWTKEPFQANRDYVCDDQGKATVDLPKTIDILRLWARHEGHVSLFANWWPEREVVPRKFPQEFTFTLDRGTTIGGVVKNDDGEPIAGAKVWVMLVNPNEEKGLDQHPIPNIWLADVDRSADTRRTTDANGHWTLDNAPAGDEFDFRIMLIHPDYVSDYLWGGLQNEQGVTAKALRDKTGTIVMHRGVSLTGVVTDARGNPIHDALVVWGDDPYMQQGCQEARTDEKGRYHFPPLLAGPLHLTVVAQDYAARDRQFKLSPGDSSADFELVRGKKLRVRFVDNKGAPIGGVGVSIESWRGHKALYNHKHSEVLDSKIPDRSNEDGLYEWTWAPEDPVIYSFYKEGYDLLMNHQLIAGSETDHKIVLARQQKAK